MIVRKRSKHQSSVVAFANLIGGINISQVGEQIGENEMQACENFVYGKDSKRLVGRGGISTTPTKTFGFYIKDMYFDIDVKLMMVFLVNGEIRIIENNADRYLGQLSGNDLPICCKFQNKLWIASGGHLQYYDYGESKSLFTVSESPICNIVFQRMARLAVVKTGSDIITYSAIGDGTKWEHNDNDDSTAQFLEIGYGDSGDIVSVVPLATDLIILKSNGLVYQFSGDKATNTWTVNNIGSLADIVGINTATNIGNNVVFISNRGLKSIATTMDYGNIATSDIGDKFNGLITNKLFEPRVFHLKRHSTILIRPTNNWSFFVAFNYLLNAATVLRFGIPISSVVETADGVFVASKNGLFKWANEFVNDSGVSIKYLLKPRDIIGADELLVKYIDTKFSSDRSGEAVVKTDKLSVKTPTNARKKIKCNHSTAKISLEVTSDTRFELDHIAIEVSNL